MIKKVMLWVFVSLGFITIILWVAFKVISSQVDLTPKGCRCELFKDTPVWELAKAVNDEDTMRIGELIHEKHFNVNYQEHKSKWGTTVLVLAVLNNKSQSVKALLENGARLDIKDSTGGYPLNNFLSNLLYQKPNLGILKLMLQHGADPNKIGEAYYQKEDTIPYQVFIPLCQAVYNIECTKLLLEYGADMYYQNPTKLYSLNDSQIKYPVWSSLMGNVMVLPNKWDFVHVARYLIVDKQMPIPDPLEYLPDTTIVGNPLRPFSALDYLNRAKFTDSDKQKAKEEIMTYLKKEGFPEHGVLRDGKVIR